MAVPNTTTFSLDDVRVELGLSYPTSLDACFTASIDGGFDPSYKGAKDRLSNFRNYQHSIATTSITIVDEKSASNACTRWTASPELRYTIYIPDGQTFSTATALYSTSDGLTLAPADWYSNGTHSRAWNGSAFTVTNLC